MIHYRTLDIEGIWGNLESLEFDANTCIPRFRINNILKRLDRPVIEVILGPRQSGKTTLLFMIMSELLSRNIVPGQIFYINLDTIIEMEQFRKDYIEREDVGAVLVADTKSVAEPFRYEKDGSLALPLQERVQGGTEGKGGRPHPHGR